MHDLVRFPARFDEYWSDNLPFRNTIQQVYADVNFRLFGVSTTPDVIVGKNDGDWRHTWLFYNSVTDGDPIGDVCGTKQLTPEQQEEVLRSVVENTERMQKRGVELYYLIAPNKSSIYPENLPDSIKCSGRESLTSRLAGFMRERGVRNFVFLQSALEAEKQTTNVPLYYSLDTHWNDYGAFIGTRALLATMNGNFNGYDDYTVEDSGYIQRDGDLVGLTNLSVNLDERSDATVVAKYNGSYQVSEQGSTNFDKVTTTENSKPSLQKKVLVVGDSYRSAMVRWLSPIYSNVTYMHRDKYSSQVLDGIKPDIVIMEGVERYAVDVLSISL